ncbi:MAG: DUF1330 domain-containing protein [Bauldia sp.]|nr:DUF1330 domain-containing protein [Bauldia sp.]
MTKGYWIVRLDITDQEKYDAYRALNGAAFKRYGGYFLVRGGKFETLSGESRSRNVVLEFPSYQAALDCYHSPEYARALEARGGGVVIDTVVIEGYDGPQP